MSIQDFYADEHLALDDGFGSTLPPRTSPHRGLDVNRHPTGTEIPALYSGTVVRSEYQSGLGNVVCVQTDRGFYEGNSHLTDRWVGVGDRVEAGTIIGTLGNTGTLSSGAHLHKTISPSSNDPSRGAVVDPLPYIRAARDGGTPSPTPKPSSKKRKKTMLMCHVNNGSANGTAAKYAIFAPGFYFEFEGQDAANAWISQIGAGPSAAVTAGTLELIKAASMALTK